MTLTHRLHRLGRLLRLRLLALLLLCWLLLSSALVVLMVVGAHLRLPLNPLNVVIGCSLVGAGAAIGAALLWRMQTGHVARVVQHHYPALRESLLTAVELSEGPHGVGAPSGPSGASPQLVQAAIAEAAEALALIPPRSILDLHRLRPLAIAAAVAVAVAIGGAVVSRDALAEMVRPHPSYEPLPAASPVAAPVRSYSPPDLTGLQITLTPPEYTQLPPKTLNSNLTRLSALRGTRVSISALAPSTGRLALNVNARPCQLTPCAGNRLAHEFTLERDTNWEMGAGDRHPFPHRGFLRLIEDEPPSIWMKYPARDLLLKELKPVKLSALASDDHGLKEIALEYRVDSQRNWQREFLPASGNVQHVQYDWDLSPLKLQPGQAVFYRFTVWDNNPYRGPRSASTRIYKITLADRLPTEAVERLQQAAEEQRQSVERMKEQAQEIQQRLQELQQQLPGEPGQKLSPQQIGELQQAAQQLQKQAEDLKQAVSQSEQEVQRNGDALPELSQRLAEINKLLRETLDTKLQEALRQLQQAATQQQPQQAQQSLEQAQKAQEELMRQLDQLLELLKQAQLEGLLGELRQQLEHLAAQQQALIDRREKNQGERDLQAQSRDQQDLARQTDEAEQRMHDAAQQAAQQDEKTGQQLQNLAEQMKQADVPQLMRDASRQLQQANAAQAAPPQQQALENLQQLAGQLSGLQASVYQDMRQQLTQGAAELAQKALDLSERQEKLLDETGPMAQTFPEQLLNAKPRLQKLARRQEMITQGADKLAQRLQELAGKSPLVDPGLVQQAGEAAALSQQAGRDLNGGSMADAASGQRRTMERLNQLAAQLVQSQQGFQQGSAQMAMQELMRRLQQLAQQQKGLNDATKSGDMPGGGGPGGSTPAGSSLANQQGGIRQALQQMLGQAGGQSGMGQQLGGLPAEMDDVEDQLRHDQVTQRTYRQQEHILHKMLDAQRSIYDKERESRERIAEAPKPYRPPASPPILHKAPVPPLTLRASGSPRDLPLGYEDLARRYLEALSRSR